MKKIWALLLTLTLVVGVVSPITTVYAEENSVVMTVNGTEYTSHDEGWSAAVNLANGGTKTTVVLNANWNAENGDFKYSKGTDSGRLYINDSDVDLTIDLNGYNINRGLTSAKSNGQVIKIDKGKLTITDNSGEKDGKITGGYNKGNGGGIYVSGGELLLNGGCISANKAEIVSNSPSEAGSGAGVYIESGTFTMNGGSVSENVASSIGAGVFLYSNSSHMNFNAGAINGNYAGKDGGGIYLNSHSDLNMYGGIISNNIAVNDGGGVYIDNDTDNHSAYATITGGTIAGNIAKTGNGGGIYNTVLEPLTLVNCTITGNDAPRGHGGGVFVYAIPRHIVFGGNVNITGNTGYSTNPNNRTDNVYMRYDVNLYNAKGQFINTEWSETTFYLYNYPLTSNAKIGLKTEKSWAINGTYFSDKQSGIDDAVINCFTADDSRYSLKNDKDGDSYRIKFARAVEDTTPSVACVSNDDGFYQEYSHFEDAWVSALKQSKTSKTTIKLYHDWIACGGVFRMTNENDNVTGSDNGRLYINDSDIDLTIDLNGYSIDRNLDTATDSGQVFKIDSGKLTITDSVGTGEIKGANNTGNGGAFYVVDGHLYINGGTITGNRAANGGGIYMEKGYLYIDNGEIKDNNAAKGAGVYWASDNKGYLTGGKITANSASESGGGVYAANNGKIFLGGNIKIIDNTNGSLYLSQKEVNIYNAAGQDGSLHKPLTDGAKIGISASDSEDTISGDNSCFNEGDFRYMYADSSTHYIRSVYDANGGNHANKLYINSWSDKDSRYPRVKTVEVKDYSLLKSAVLNYDTQTITLTAYNTKRNFFEYATLNELISYTCDKDIYYIYEDDVMLDLRKNRDYKVMSDNGTYVLCTVKIVPDGGEWAVEQESLDDPYKMIVSHGVFNTGFTDPGKGWAYAIENSQTTPINITLLGDWNAQDGKFEYSKGTDKGRLYIDGNRDITIDLNGHNINRGLTNPVSDGQVFRLASGAKLTITDNSVRGNGKITGGNNNGNGGAFYIVGGKLYINGGNITGNKATNGGGIYMEDGYLYVDGGEISGNTAQNGAGVYLASSGEGYLTEGTITGNTANSWGGGVYVAGTGKIYLGGTIQIVDNTNANLYLAEKSSDISNAVGQTDMVPNKPLSNGAKICILAKNVNDLISAENSMFNEVDFRVMYSDDSDHYIRSVYDVNGGKHSHKLYFSNWRHDDARYPRVKTVSVKASDILKDATLDVKTQTITLTAYNTKKNFFERALLSELIECSYDQYKDNNVYYLYEMDLMRDLRKTQEYKIMSDNGTYVMCTVKVIPEDGEWADNQEPVNNPYKMTVVHGESIKGFTDFGEGWVYAVEQSKIQPVTIKLFEDWIAPDGKFEYSKYTSGGSLYLDDLTMDLTIDLNGYTINRNLTNSTSNGYVLYMDIYGSVTITDSSDAKTGKITGGNNSGSGGAVYIDYGKLYINGGNITGNKASENGGAIYVNDKDDAYIYINDGKISGNIAGNSGGAIFVYNGYLYMDGGEVFGNTAVIGGGILWESENKACLTGGKITKNTANSMGGGMVVKKNGKVYLGGDIVIDGNAELNSNLSTDNLHLYDSGVSIHNARGQEASVPNKPLTDGAKIGISAEYYGVNTYRCLSGDGSKFNQGDCRYFYSSEGDYYIRPEYTSDEENHKYKLYLTTKNRYDAKFPKIESVAVKNSELLQSAVINTDTQTITLIGYIDKKDEFKKIALDSLINYSLNADASSVLDSKTLCDFTSSAEFIIMSDKEIYDLCTVVMDWVCEQHRDTNGDYTCEYCKEYMLSNFEILNYNTETREATVFVTKPGKYSLIFADYEDNHLANVDIVEYDFVEEINVVPQEVTKFTLASDDKVMLWYDLINLVPVCDALTIK